MASSDLIAIKIDTTPQDAVVYINGENRNVYCCRKGEVVEWSVSKAGYIPQSGTTEMDDNTTLSVSLEKGEGYCVSVNVSAEG